MHVYHNHYKGYFPQPSLKMRVFFLVCVQPLVEITESVTLKNENISSLITLKWKPWWQTGEFNCPSQSLDLKTYSWNGRLITTTALKQLVRTEYQPVGVYAFPQMKQLSNDLLCFKHSMMSLSKKHTKNKWTLFTNPNQTQVFTLSCRILQILNKPQNPGLHLI